ncbi:MAG TPA: hemerythrin domain-containing protein [Candidatus Binatia bacterium]|nr:hemerythrin domain-containing protein [Candidatus Binatia bacterium]
MAFLESSDLLRKEHLEILRVAEHLSQALALAGKEDFTARQQGLAGLRVLRPALLGVSRHCCCEEGVLESPYHRYLDGQRFEQVDGQHKAIHRLVLAFLRDVLYATADSIADSVPQGEELVEKIREHIAYEENLLDYIEELCLVTT